MGKKISPASPKISKKHHEKNKQKQQQINSFIKVLRPKVYITDSSRFKSLVQELTGNGNGSSNKALPSPISSPPIYARTVDVDDNKISSISILDDIDQEEYHIGVDVDPDQISSSCMEAVSDTSLDSFEPCNNYYRVSYSSVLEEEFKKNDTIYDQIFLEETTTSVDYLLMNQEEADLFGNQDLESWLLDMEPYSSYNNVSAQIQQEVSIYDYELSGLLI